MKIHSLLLILASMCQMLSAQTPDIERLLEKADKAYGKEKIDLLADLCKNYYSVDPHRGIRYGEQAIRIADSLKIPSSKSKVFNNIGVNYWALSDWKTAREFFINARKNAVIFRDSLQIAISYNRMGLLYESLGIFDSSLYVFNQELAIYKRIKNDERTCTALENIGTIHLNRGEYGTATAYLLEALTIAEKRQDLNKLAYLYMKLGKVYAETKDFTEAEKWLNKGIDLSVAGKDLMKAAIGYNALGIVYKNEGKYEKALAEFDTALQTLKNLNNKSLTMAIFANTGNVYNQKKDYRKAILFHRQSLDLALQLKSPMAIARQKFDLGRDYYSLGDYRRARTLYEESLPALSANKNLSDLLSVYQGLINVNNSLKDYQQSGKYYELYISLKDSLNQKELNKALDSLKIRFHTEQTDLENVTLKKETVLKSKTISLQQTVLIIGALFLVLLIVLVYVIVKNHRKIKKANELLGWKNDEISTKAKELHDTNETLVELIRFKDSLTAFIAHDLKNALNTIVNIDAWSSSERQVELVKNSGKRMLNLVMNMLDISKFESGKMRMDIKEASIGTMIKNACDQMTFLADQKSLRIRVDHSVDYPVKVDPEMMERVLVNLLDNAIRHSAIGEEIEICKEITDSNRLKITVKDHGEGIEAEFLPHVFSKYAVAGTEKLGNGRSFGLGLTFCKLAIESLGGEIGVESKAGRGASFWFTLPLPEQPGYRTVSADDRLYHSTPDLEFQLTGEEVRILKPTCDLLRNLSIHQISDVKDILNAFNPGDSAGLKAWKSLLTKALYECNHVKYDDLVNLEGKNHA